MDEIIAHMSANFKEHKINSLKKQNPGKDATALEEMLEQSMVKERKLIEGISYYCSEYSELMKNIQCHVYINYILPITIILPSVFLLRKMCFVSQSN